MAKQFHAVSPQEGVGDAKIKAGEDLLQYDAVKVVDDDGTDVYKKCEAAADACVGVTLQGASEGDDVSIVIDGVTKARLGGGVDAFDYLIPNASGNGEAVVEADDGYRFAQALQPGADGDIVPAMILPNKGVMLESA